MLLTTKQLLDIAYENGFAVPAFNVNDLEMVQAVFRAAEMKESPVIIQTASEEIEFGGGNSLYDIIYSVGEQYKLPYAIHLDHGPDYKTCIKCILRGYSSVMFDGSILPYENNIEITKKVTEAAHAAGLSVEAELGKLGGLDENGAETGAAALTDPGAAEEFSAVTEIDSFAPAIGTLHGFYRGEPFLDFPRLKEINARVKKPLVLHGGSGLSKKAVKTAAEAGISKINFSTALRKAFIDSIRKYMQKNPDDYSTINIMRPAIEAFSREAENIIDMCGSSERKGLYNNLKVFCI